MGSIPFALSIHHFISSVGSDAGFASIIGLAILILLYFAQARETASLRSHAYEAAERIQHLEGRLAQLTRGQSASQPQHAQPQQVARPQPAEAAATARSTDSDSRIMAPGAPAGVAAPALTAATRLIPAAFAPAEASGSAVALADPPSAGNGPGAPGGGAGTPPASPAPATAAGGANGASQSRARAVPAGQGAPSAPPRPASLTPTGTRSGAPPPRRPSVAANGGRSLRWLVIPIAVLGIAAVVAAVLVITNNGSSTSSSATASSASTAGGHHARVVAPSSVTVAVLNGTAASGLAHRVALQLSGAGYKQGTVATATDQTHSSTTVAYLPGFRRDATAVAASLKLKPSAVQPVDQSTQTVACPPPSACTANVVVTVGTNLANTP